MLNKLAFRNARRAMKDYIIYLLTMILVTALMFSFNSMIFSKAIQKLCAEAGIMAAMLGVATFFIVLIIVWLVHYMVKFMAEKRSREFGTYLLLGFHKKQIANLFLRENLLIGLAAFAVGLIPGFFMQQVMTTIIYAIMNRGYRLTLEINGYTFLMTAGVYLLSFILALFRNKRRFRKMNIRDMLYLDKQNEQMKNSNKSGKKWMFFAAAAYIIMFLIVLYTGNITELSALPLAAGLFIAIYFLYMGLSAFLVGYIKKGGAAVYKNADVFVLRQLASKVKTMQFTLGTLTILFSVAIVGYACAFMLNQYQNTQADEQWPFDVMVASADAGETFEQEMDLINNQASVNSFYRYEIYENGSDVVNKYMVSNVKLADRYAYFAKDTYMKLSDYNYLRRSLGYSEVSLNEGQYLIHMNERIRKIGEQFAGEEELKVNGRVLGCAGVYSEGFEQGGHNGADYILVVPDMEMAGMTPMYSVLMAELKGTVPEGLGDRLFDIQPDSGDDWAYGTGMIYVNQSMVHVRDNEVAQMKFMLSSLIFPLFYIGLVFLCAALTVLSVQQLSDSDKYKFRYQVLRKLGLKQQEVNRIILKQLAVYYLCPFLAAIVLSVGITAYVGDRFVYYSGVRANALSYAGVAVLAFGLIYLLYFCVTYVEFKRNVDIV